MPVDYSRPEGSQVHLAVIEHEAPAPIGVLFTNPGGPGGSGVDEIRQNVQYWPRLTRNFDLVSFDPRGSNRSDPIHCLGSSRLDSLFAVDPVPATPRQFHRLAAASRSYVKGCRAHSGQVLGFVDGLDQARDMDRVRAALGEHKISYLGFSYGTDLGAVYASRYDEHVRALVLDGDAPPDLSAFDFVAGQARGFERNLHLFLGYCRRTSSCPYRAEAGSDASLLALLDRLDRSPMPAGDRMLTAAEAYYALGANLYGTRGWPYLATALAAAEQGNGAPMLQAFDRYMGRDAAGRYSGPFDPYNATICEDKKWPSSPPTYRRWAQELDRRFPVFGAQIAYAALPCAYWPGRGGVRASLSPVRSPALLVGATQDPATLYAWTIRLHDQLQGSTVLTRKGAGHTSYFASSCVMRAVDRFLISLKRPPSGTVCPSKP